MSMGMEKEGKDAMKKRLASKKAADKLQKTYNPAKGNEKRRNAKELSSLKGYKKGNITVQQSFSLGEKGLEKSMAKAESKMRQSDKAKMDKGTGRKGGMRLGGLGSLRGGAGYPRIK